MTLYEDLSEKSVIEIAEELNRVGLSAVLGFNFINKLAELQIALKERYKIGSADIKDIGQELDGFDGFSLIAFYKQGKESEVRAFREGILEELETEADTIDPEDADYTLKQQNSLLRQCRFISNNGEFWRYDRRSGIYKRNASEFIGWKLRTQNNGLKTRTLNEIVEGVKDRSWLDEVEMNSAVSGDMLNLRDGILNMRSFEVAPHSSSYNFLSKLDFSIKSDATCPEIIKFMVDITFPDPKKFIMLLEEGGYIFIEKTIFQKAFVHVGVGNNGKDKYAEILRRMLGVENMVSVSFAELITNRFRVAQLRGKLANIGSEIGKDLMEDSNDAGIDVFKKLVTGDRLNAEEKFGRPFDMENKAKIISNANELPRTKLEYALSRRLSFIEFDTRFVDGEDWKVLSHQGYDEYMIFDKKVLVEDTRTKFVFEKNPNIADIITSENEVSGYLNLLLLTRNKLLTKNQFTYIDSADVTSRKYAERSGNTFFLFKTDCLESKTGGELWFEEIYKKYIEYCKQHGYTAGAGATLGKWLNSNNDLGFEVQETTTSSDGAIRKVTRYIGVDFKADYDFKAKKKALKPESFSVVVDRYFSTIKTYLLALQTQKEAFGYSAVSNAIETLDKLLEKAQLSLPPVKEG